MPDLARGVAPAGSRFTRDARWTQAAKQRPIDLEILAKREGAVGLLEGVEQGGSTARTALAAFPFAPDAEVVVGQLCDWALAAPHDQTEPYLRSIHGVVSHPPEPTEPMDRSGLHHCDVTLKELLRRSDLAESGRDLAASARRLIAEHSGHPD